MGQFVGAVIMFFVLGFVPGYVLSWILKQAGLLRIPREVEIAGLDYVMLATTRAGGRRDPRRASPGSARGSPRAAARPRPIRQPAE